MVRHFSVCIGLLIILTSCRWTHCSAAALSMEDKFRELELRLGTTVQGLEKKNVEFEARSVQVEEKVSQLEAQLELNVSLINLHQFGIDYIFKKS
jgi:hypothetical protein